MTGSPRSHNFAAVLLVTVALFAGPVAADDCAGRLIGAVLGTFFATLAACGFIALIVYCCACRMKPKKPKRQAQEIVTSTLDLTSVSALKTSEAAECDIIPTYDVPENFERVLQKRKLESKDVGSLKILCADDEIGFRIGKLEDSFLVTEVQQPSSLPHVAHLQPGNLILGVSMAFEDLTLESAQALLALCAKNLSLLYVQKDAVYSSEDALKLHLDRSPLRILDSDGVAVDSVDKVNSHHTSSAAPKAQKRKTAPVATPDEVVVILEPPTPIADEVVVVVEEPKMKPRTPSPVKVLEQQRAPTPVVVRSQSTSSSSSDSVPEAVVVLTNGRSDSPDEVELEITVETPPPPIIRKTPSLHLLDEVSKPNPLYIAAVARTESVASSHSTLQIVDEVDGVVHSRYNNSPREKTRDSVPPTIHEDVVDGIKFEYGEVEMIAMPNTVVQNGRMIVDDPEKVASMDVRMQPVKQVTHHNGTRSREDSHSRSHTPSASSLTLNNSDNEYIDLQVEETDVLMDLDGRRFENRTPSPHYSVITTTSEAFEQQGHMYPIDM